MDSTIYCMFTVLCYAGIDYIKFFDLDLDDGGQLEIVKPDFIGFFSGDYFSRPIYVDSGIPIGAREELTTILYVSFF